MLARCRECAFLALRACSQSVPARFIHSFIRSFVLSFVHWFAHACVRAAACRLLSQSVGHGLFVHSFVHSFIQLLIYSFIDLFIRSFSLLSLSLSPFSLLSSLSSPPSLLSSPIAVSLCPSLCFSCCFVPLCFLWNAPLLAFPLPSAFTTAAVSTSTCLQEAPCLLSCCEQPAFSPHFLRHPPLAADMPSGAAAQTSVAPVAASSKSSPGLRASPSWATIPKPMAGNSRRVKVEDLSPCTGWRDAQPGVVAHFVAVFPDTYGQSITGGIKVLSSDSEFKLCARDSSQKIIIDDGRSTVAALLELKARVDADEAVLDSFCLHLREVMIMGVPVTPLFYEDSSAIFRTVWNTSCHTEENNKYLAATIADHVKAVTSVANMFPGETKWEKASSYLLSVYGKSKRRSIHRWLTLAKRLPREVIGWVEARVANKGLEHSIRDAYFYDNPYLGGTSSQLQLQLPASSAVAALDWLAVALDTGSAAARGKKRTLSRRPSAWFGGPMGTCPGGPWGLARKTFKARRKPAGRSALFPSVAGERL